MMAISFIATSAKTSAMLSVAMDALASITLLAFPNRIPLDKPLTTTKILGIVPTAFPRRHHVPAAADVSPEQSAGLSSAGAASARSLQETIPWNRAMAAGSTCTILLVSMNPTTATITMTLLSRRLFALTAESKKISCSSEKNYESAEVVMMVRLLERKNKALHRKSNEGVEDVGRSIPPPLVMTKFLKTSTKMRPLSGRRRESAPWTWWSSP
jgi:hypothetical protein